MTHPPLTSNLRVDVLVLGGGITGITAAYLLKKLGKRVALLERGTIAPDHSGNSTAHMTAIIDTPLSRLIEQLGPQGAHAVWQAGFASISRLRAIVRDERINCRFAWMRGCLHASSNDVTGRRAAVVRELNAAESLGLEVRFVEDRHGVSGPWLIVDNQARFDPVAYLDVLASRIAGEGSHLFECTQVDAFEEGDPLVARAGPYRILTDYVIVAEPGLAVVVPGDPSTRPLRTNLVECSSYTVRGISPPGTIDEGLYLTHHAGSCEYLRIDRSADHDDVIFGGQRHDGAAMLDDLPQLAVLDERLRARVPGVTITSQSVAHVIRTRDGLPYIGEVSPRRFIATGYGGNGMTFGTLGGMMAADAVLGRANPWADLFGVDPERRSRQPA
ncbi:MAG: FAD-binding oxidoreductase [Vicinamibacterales bacterium]